MRRGSELGAAAALLDRAASAPLAPGLLAAASCRPAGGAQLVHLLKQHQERPSKLRRPCCCAARPAMLCCMAPAPPAEILVVPRVALTLPAAGTSCRPTLGLTSCLRTGRASACTMPSEKSTLTLLPASLSMRWVSPPTLQCHAAWHGVAAVTSALCAGAWWDVQLPPEMAGLQARSGMWLPARVLLHTCAGGCGSARGMAGQGCRHCCNRAARPVSSRAASCRVDTRVTRAPCLWLCRPQRPALAGSRERAGRDAVARVKPVPHRTPGGRPAASSAHSQLMVF